MMREFEQFAPKAIVALQKRLSRKLKVQTAMSKNIDLAIQKCRTDTGDKRYVIKQQATVEKEVAEHFPKSTAHV